jgi:ElaB/YqjD/DUF883 family membrane-anchored ribosome-binding protein
MDQERSDIEDAIARDREQLASTVRALEHKADVKARVHEKLDEVRTRFRDSTPANAQQPAQAAMQMVRSRPVPFVAAATFALGVLVGRMWMRGAA